MLRIDALVPGSIHRGQSVYEMAGGKGVNVSRAAKRLGYPTLATGFLGGYVGERIRQLLDEEAIEHDFVSIRSTTRSGVTLKIPGQPLTAFYDPAHQLTAEDTATFLRKFPAWLETAGFCIIAGSMPHSGFDDFYAELVRMCHRQGVPCLVDTYGPPLRKAADAAPVMIKTNVTEYARAYGLNPAQPHELLQVMEQQVAKGTAWMMLTHGAEPALALIDGRQYVLTPPQIAYVNALGSGDCVDAGLAIGYLEGWPVESTLKFAMAAGSANASTWDPAAINRAQVENLMQQVNLKIEG